MRYPADAVVFEVTTGGTYLTAGFVGECVDHWRDDVTGVAYVFLWGADAPGVMGSVAARMNLAVLGFWIVACPVDEVRPLTRAARAMLAIVRRV